MVFSLNFPVFSLCILCICLLSHGTAFAPLPKANTSPRVLSSIGLHFGGPFETSVLETATTAIVAAESTSGSAVSNFLLGSAVFVGAVAAVKWNGPEYSDNIREKFDKLTAKPTPLEDAFVPGSTTPLDSAVSESASGMPKAKTASSPQELTEMMKDVSDSIGSTKKKKRFVVKLLQKIVMPWRKWSNL